MSKEILNCPKCKRYTLNKSCPKCSSETFSNMPAKFSIEDKYGKYRRIFKENEMEH